MPNNDMVDNRLYVQNPPTQVTNDAWNDKSAGELLVDKEYARNNIAKVQKLMRCGVPDGIRSLVWVEILELHQLHDRERNYKLALSRVFGSNIPINLTPPVFGGHLRPDCLALNAKGVQSAQRILAIIGHDFPNLEYCPFIPAIVSLLLHHLTPDEVLGTLMVLIKSSISGGEWTYFPTYRRDINAFFSGFGDYLSKRNLKLYRHIQDLHLTKPAPIWKIWLSNFFIGVLPLGLIFRIYDAFLHEGFKVLYQFALAMLTLKRNEIFSCNSFEDMEKLFRADSPTPQFDEEELAKTAFSMPMKLEEISAYRTEKLAAVSNSSLSHGNSNRSLSKIGVSSTATSMYHRPKPSLSEKSAIALDEDWVNIWTWVPVRYRLLDLKLLFTTKKDGHHIKTFYEKAKELEPLLVIIETSDNHVFGAYISKSLADGKGDRKRFIGTGESFLYSLSSNNINYYPWVGANVPDAGSVSAPPGSHAEKIRDTASFFVMVGKDELAVGGGGAGYGLWVNETLTEVTSTTCTTFNNEPLGGPGTDDQPLDVHVLELWGFT